MSPRIKAVHKYLNTKRVIQWLHALLYLFTAAAGLIAFLSMPTLLVHLIGQSMTDVFGVFSIVGSLTALVGVIIRSEWIERVGILLLLTAVIMYVVMLIYTGVTVIATWFAMALAISLVQRLLYFNRPYDL